MTVMNGLDRQALAEGLAEAGAEGWLIFDFRGVNPIAGRVLGVGGMGSRRLFVWLPAAGGGRVGLGLFFFLLPAPSAPVAVAHKIELQPLRGFPGRVVPYARWEELHQALQPLVAGRTVAMEISGEDAVPYLDRVPFGVVELVRRLGGRVVSSGSLVTRFGARWTDAERADHSAAAEALAGIARDTLADVVGRAGTGLTESAVQQRVVEAIRGAGLAMDHPPIVAFGASAADPHYEPIPGRDAVLSADQVVLLDLWGGPSLGVPFADQTWMGYSGAVPSAEVVRVWDAVRAAREAAIDRVVRAISAGEPIRGFEVDRAARRVIEAAGYGEYFVHRTGHSIDRDLHGSGPHCDDYETRDDRVLMEGVGFSIEPGVYFPGRFGVRSEVNMYWGPEGAVVTPRERQEAMITAGRAGGVPSA